MAQILFVDTPNNCPLPDKNVLAAALGTEAFLLVSSLAAAAQVMANHKISILVSNDADFKMFALRRQQDTKLKNILVTSLPMQEYSQQLRGQEEQLLDHIISHRFNGFWTLQDLRITLAKLQNPQDIFGIAKYLNPHTTIHNFTVTGSADRETYNSAILQYAIDCKLGQHLAKVAFGITEELLMNAIHDAPLAAGLPHYLNLERTAPVSLRPTEYAQLSFGCDGRIFAISIQDPLGALKRHKLYTYLKKVLKRKDSIDIIDTKAGGAGLGFFKILYSSHALVCNVAPNRCTEVIALIDITEQIRDFNHMTRSIHYFSTEPDPAVHDRVS